MCHLGIPKTYSGVAFVHVNWPNVQVSMFIKHVFNHLSGFSMLFSMLLLVRFKNIL